VIKTLIASWCCLPMIAFAADLQPGTNQVELKHDGHLRKMLVRLPDDYSPEKKYPVVFGFHGAGGPMESYHRHLEGLVDHHSVISVSPQGISKPQGKSGWNGFANHRLSNTDDVGFVVKTVEHLAKHASIDRHRLYATGGSSGAIFCFRLAMETDIFAAIAPMRGAMIKRPPVPKNRPKLSILYVGGSDDELFTGEGSADPAEVFYSANETMSLWAANHGVETPEPTQEAAPPNVTLTGFSPPESSYELLLYAVNGSGHRLEKKDMENAIRFMGKFFSKHTKRSSLGK
jgi:poly(3-hydroxybutyrate) depolymerase